MEFAVTVSFVVFVIFVEFTVELSFVVFVIQTVIFKTYPYWQAEQLFGKEQLAHSEGHSK